MCWSCNAICGGCRPPRKRPVKCPECGGYNVFDLEKNMGTKTCKKCGLNVTELAIPEPLECNYCGEICYNPCKKAKQDPADGELHECNLRVTEPFVTD